MRRNLRCSVILAAILLGIFQNCSGGFKAQESSNLKSVAESTCFFKDQILASGETAGGFSASSVPFGQSCDTVKIPVTCENGNLSPTTASATCATITGASCAFNGKSMASGETVQAYQAVSVPFGSTCTSQTRTCTNGTLDGSYQFASCSVNAPLNCTFNNMTVLSGAGTQGYPSATVPYGQTCQAATVTCTNGVLNPANHVGSCSVQAGASCSFNGQTIPSGGTTQGYPSTTVPYGQTCTPATLTCTNGTLTPANHVAACKAQETVEPCSPGRYFFNSNYLGDPNKIFWICLGCNKITSELRIVSVAANGTFQGLFGFDDVLDRGAYGYAIAGTCANGTITVTSATQRQAGVAERLNTLSVNFGLPKPMLTPVNKGVTAAPPPAFLGTGMQMSVTITDGNTSTLQMSGVRSAPLQ